MTLLLPFKRLVVVALSALLFLPLASCDQATPVQPVYVLERSHVMWGLGWCPDCNRRQPTETENAVLWEAWTYNIDGTCLDQAIGTGAYSFIEESLLMGTVGVDEDVMSRPEWDYATGYWIPFNLRYQYGWNALMVAEQVITSQDRREAAKVLVHETAHEFDFDEDDESLIVAIELLCTSN